MSKLIIITGISGTGKSSIANMMYKKMENSTLLSFDVLKETIYDIIGFRNKSQKKSLREITGKMYKKLIEEAIKRDDDIVIIEYPFKKKWLKFFENIINKYQCEVYTINVFTKDFDALWKRLENRENSKERHPSHYLESYSSKKKEDYVPYFEYSYTKHKKEYEELTANSINLGKVINVEDIETLDIDKLIKEIID